jgi:surface protein
MDSLSSAVGKVSLITMSFAGIDDLVPEDVRLHILSFFDVRTLVKKKAVCHSWKMLLTQTIIQKASTPKAFESHKELTLAVHRYMMYDPDDAENFATTYGWPIGRWDVSNVEDFRCMFSIFTKECKSFEFRSKFNEDISSWDVSNATTMYAMFEGASLFNKDISSWDISNVQDMSHMFEDASSFNQDISSWNTSRVINMKFMFVNASSFNQDLTAWKPLPVGLM